MDKKNNSFTFKDFIILAIICFIGYKLFFSGTDKTQEKKDVESKEEKTRTIMIYMAPSDLESVNYHGTKDLNSINSSFDSEHNKLVVMAGGTKEWHNNFTRETTIYDYSDGQFNRKDNCIGHQNMGDVNTLNYFLDYVYDSYKSDEYILMFYGHGYGVDGVLPDEVYDDNLSLTELTFGIFNSKFNKEAPSYSDYALDLVIFSSCLMGTYETYESLNVLADYVIASEEVTWFVGNKSLLSYFNNIKSTDDIETIGKNYIDYYKDYISGSGLDNYYHNLSLVNMHELLISPYIEDLFGSIDVDINYSDILSIRSNMHQFGNESYLDEVDLYDLMTRFSKYDKGNNYKKFTDYFNKAVVYNYTNHSEAMHGMSIYFPYYNGTVEDDYILGNSSIYNSGKYSKFIDRIMEKQKEDYSY